MTDHALQLVLGTIAAIVFIWYVWYMFHLLETRVDAHFLRLRKDLALPETQGPTVTSMIHCEQCGDLTVGRVKGRDGKLRCLKCHEGHAPQSYHHTR